MSGEPPPLVEVTERTPLISRRKEESRETYTQTHESLHPNFSTQEANSTNRSCPISSTASRPFDSAFPEDTSASRHSRLRSQDSLILSPFQNYRKHGSVPYRFILHTLLLVVVSVYLILESIQFSTYFEHYMSACKRLLLFEPRPSYLYSYPIYTTPALQAHLSACISNYFHFNSSSVSLVKTAPLIMLAVSTVANGTQQFTVDSSARSSPLGPLENGANVRAAYRIMIYYSFSSSQRGGIAFGGPFESIDYK